MATFLSSIAIHDPLRLSDDDFKKSFVARQDLADRFLNQLRQLQPGKEVRKHHLIVGQRGMGKTSLLRRVALMIEDDDELAKTLLPITFREEQYDVRKLGQLWQNCAESLADRFESRQKKALTERLDELIATTDWQDSDAAYEQFRAFCESIQARPVLFIDNADMIFEAIGGNQQWEFRGILQARGGPLLVAASTKHLETSADPDAAFYEFFRIHQLEPLTADELMICLRRLADARGERGQQAAEKLRKEPHRIRALHQLTGGNPRTLALIYQMLEGEASSEVFSDLELLFDSFTPLYKARIEELPTDQRSVFDAISLNWDPISLANLSKATGIKKTSLPSHLSRLEVRGLITPTKSSRAAKNYIVVERFFNIWYLMRHGTRRRRQRVRWLTAFLTSYYAPKERHAIAERLLKQREFTPQSHTYVFAMAETMEIPSLGRALRQRLSSEMRQSPSTRDAVARIVDLDDVDPVSAEGESLKRQLSEIGWSREKQETFWQDVMSLVDLTWKEKATAIRQAGSLNSSQIDEFRRLAGRQENEHRRILGTVATEDLKAALVDTHIRDRSDLDGAIAVARRFSRPHVALCVAVPVKTKDQQPIEDRKFNEIVDLAAKYQSGCDPVVTMLLARLHRAQSRNDKAEELLRRATAMEGDTSLAWSHLGNILTNLLDRHSDAEQAYRTAVKINPDCAWAWHNLGTVLTRHLERHYDAEQALRKAVQIDPSFDSAWRDLGIVLTRWLERFEEANEAIRTAIEINPNDALAWSLLGIDSTFRLGDHKEAESAFQKSLSINPGLATVWQQLGTVLTDHLSQHEEAAKAFQEATKIDSELLPAWTSLGMVLTNHLDRHDEAEMALKKAIEVNPELASTWGQLGDLLTIRLDRHDEAAKAYERACEVDPKLARAWTSLGLVLTDRLDRHEEAETAFKRAVEVDPGLAWVWGRLGTVLTDHLGRHEEAEMVFKKAIEINPQLAWVWGRLGDLLTYRMERHEEAELAFRKAVNIDPKINGVWGWLGVVLASHLEQYEEAKAAFEKAVEVDPELASLWWAQIGNISFDRMGRYAAAIDAYQNGLAVAESAEELVLKANIAWCHTVKGLKRVPREHLVFSPFKSGTCRQTFALLSNPPSLRRR